MSEPLQKVAPDTAVAQHTVQPDEPWYHPHHIMHHGDKIITAIGLIAVALFAAWLKHKHTVKKRASK